MSKTFCPIPWIHQATRNNGDIRLCCQANITGKQGMVRKEDGTPYNAGRDDVAVAFNADLLKEVRKDMLSGRWNPECARCKIEEESGLPTRRLNELDQWSDRFTFEDAVAATAEDGTVSLKPRYYDLRFGNFCNLKCRMCGPTDSHSWYEEHTEFHKEEGFFDTQGFVKLVRNDKGRWTSNDYNWHETEHFWEQLEANIENVEHVYMVGGEPLLIERHEIFLQKCIDLGCAKNILLEYNTNLTVLPERILNLWSHFKKVRVGASIDGYGAVQEYQRFPIKWSTTIKNLELLDKYAAAHDNVMPSIALTVTAYNAFHIPEFMWWKLFESGLTETNGVERRPIVSHHMAHGPLRVNVQMFPAHIKDKLKQHYGEWIEKFKASDLPDYVKQAADDILTSIVNFMYMEDHSVELAEFIRFTKFLDQKRGQDIRTVVPQLGELFD